MKLLSINTAFPACDVAVLDHSHVAAHRREPMTRGQDARLATLCDEVLAQAGVTMDALDRIAVVTGPGSFTGVRVGVAFARGLALALEIPCLGVTSLEAAMPPGFRGPTLGALPAQVRPPDLTYWTQRFDLGGAIEAPVERGLDDLVGDLNQQAIPLFGFGLEDALGGQDHFHLAGAYSKGHASESTMGGCVTVPAYHGHSGLGDPKLGTDYMDDPLIGMIQTI